MTETGCMNHSPRTKALFICGSINQTTQMHQVARELPEVDAYFSPYYADQSWMRFGHRIGITEWCIMGRRLQKRCLDYLEAHNLPIDVEGRRGGYDFTVSSSDLVIPNNIRKAPVIVVQEGILDLPNKMTELCKRYPLIPRWFGGTAMTGLSGLYDRFCCASEGYREHFIREGADPEKVVATGIPNFDDCERYYQSDFPHRGYVLVCTSDMRETFKFDDRNALIRKALRIADGRQLIFKLHPNERVDRATREIKEIAPNALVYSTGSAEEMVAKCDVLITQWSSLTFVGLALNKEVHSNFDLETLKPLIPSQNRRAAANIANVCREELARFRETVSLTESSKTPSKKSFSIHINNAA